MHDIVDAASLELARTIATRLRKQPELLAVARINLRRWTLRNADSPSLLRCYREWEEILEQPLESILGVLCAESDEAQRLRQNSPFAGILKPKEVWAIKREVRSRETTPA